MRALSANDQAVLDVAIKAMSLVGQKANISVASAAQSVSGKIFTGYNFGRGHYLGSICGEIAALIVGTADCSPPESFVPKTIVSVKRNDAGKFVVANSCGSCLQRFKDDYPELEIISVDDTDTLIVARPGELLLHGYDTHRVVVEPKNEA